MPLARFQRPALPDTTGSLGTLQPGLLVPPTFPDLLSAWLGRAFFGLVLAVAAVAVAVGMTRDHQEAQYLLRSGQQVIAFVTNVWTTHDGRSSAHHVAVALDGRPDAELDKYDGDPREGQQLAVLVDPRDGTVWEASSARHVAAEPIALVDGVDALAGAMSLGWLWLLVWPWRLSRRLGRATDLHVVRGTVSRVTRINGSRSRAPAWELLVTDPRGGGWRASLNGRSWAEMKPDVLGLQGAEVSLVMIGDRFSPSSGALLVPAYGLPSGRQARWCHRFPEAVAPVDLPAAPG